MKMNIKGLVFVGFAAAVFASAAKADPDPNAKKVTSYAFTEATYQKKLTTDENSHINIDSNNKISATYSAFTGAAGGNGLVPASGAVAGKVLSGDGSWVEVDGTPYEQGTGITINDHTISNAGVREVTATPSTGTDGTITVNTNGSSAEVAVKGLQAAAYLGKDESIDSSSTHNDAATAKAVYDFVTSAEYEEG